MEPGRRDDRLVRSRIPAPPNPAVSPSSQSAFLAPEATRRDEGAPRSRPHPAESGRIEGCSAAPLNRRTNAKVLSNWSQNGHRVRGQGCHGLAQRGIKAEIGARSQIRYGPVIDVTGGRGMAGAELQNRCGAVVPSWVGSTPMHSRQIQNLGKQGADREVCALVY